MENLDLDINNYTIKDIERFFQLNPNSSYTASDIEYKEYKIREQLLGSGYINKRFKRDLIEFLTSAKDWLTFVKCKKTNPTTIPKNYKLDNLDTPLSKEPNPRTDELITRPETTYIHTSNGDYFPGSMNPLKTRIISKCLTIDTLFRDDYYSTQSSDFIFQIPEKINKVVSMQLGSFELPITWYGISSSYGNNFFFITVKYNPIIFAANGDVVDTTNNISTIRKKFIVPDGNYNSIDFITTINGLISYTDLSGNAAKTNIFSYIQLSLDITNSGSGTGKVTISRAGKYADNIHSIELNFALDENGEPNNTNVSTRIGWNLGFHQAMYSGKYSYTAETIVEPATTRYIFLIVDDFTNSAQNNYISAFKNSILSPNILARVSVRGSYFSLLMDNDHSVISEPRRYFGPVDIQRIRIRLMDEYGRILNMNNANFSFSVILKILYDV